MLLLPFLFLTSFTHSLIRTEYQSVPDTGVDVSESLSRVVGLKSLSERSPETPQMPQKEELGTVPSAMSGGNQDQAPPAAVCQAKPSSPGRSEVIARKQRGSRGKRRGLPCGVPGLRPARQGQQVGGKENPSSMLTILIKSFLNIEKPEYLLGEGNIMIL